MAKTMSQYYFDLGYSTYPAFGQNVPVSTTNRQAYNAGWLAAQENENTPQRENVIDGLAAGYGLGVRDHGSGIFRPEAFKDNPRGRSLLQEYCAGWADARAQQVVGFIGDGGKLCARPDCNKAFAPTQLTQKHCSKYCKELMVSRRARTKKRAKKRAQIDLLIAEYQNEVLPPGQFIKAIKEMGAY